MSDQQLYDEGSVHGRFQILHNEHLEYILGAKERCRYLWIGLTQFDIRNLAPSPALHRQMAVNNPLTFAERVEMITDALVMSGIDRDEFGFVPFPIENWQRLPDFLPLAVPCFTTICDEWNEEKIRRLEGIGYT